jgi:hypothetical protein
MKDRLQSAMLYMPYPLLLTYSHFYIDSWPCVRLQLKQPFNVV